RGNEQTGENQRHSAAPLGAKNFHSAALFQQNPARYGQFGAKEEPASEGETPVRSSGYPGSCKERSVPQWFGPFRNGTLLVNADIF
ncbi:MAG: hypothetical protein JXA71_16905, partial [Chitinispirillaceae bacterium]|nr:hypothetical protein [Chitinispirillaceae bacterium]